MKNICFYRRLKTRTESDERGFSLPAILSLILALGLIGAALLMTIMNNFFVVGNAVRRQQAFNIAEAGVNYYLWHMAHNGSDFKDGKDYPATGDPNLGFGPYVHNYIGDDGSVQGTYTLWVRPQTVGSTVAKVRSIGKTNDGTIRTIEAQIGATSFASYGLIANTEVWFGDSEAANGPVFSNTGIHLDGPNTDTAGSGRTTYRPDARYGGDGAYHDGVWCSNSVPTCAARDKTNWLYPRPTVDFNQVKGALCIMKRVAFANDSSTSPLSSLSNACQQTPASRSSAYIPRYSSNSFTSDRGYFIQLNTNNTYDLYKVSAEDDTETTYQNALSRSVVQTGIAIPSSGVIFVEDNVWVRTNPSFHGRVTIAAGRLASDTEEADINIVGNLLYSSKTSTDAIGLIAENNVIISPYAPPPSGSFTFEIDAAALAVKGSVTWPDEYKTDKNYCTPGWAANDQKFVFYGSVATFQNWTWNYTRGGYCANAKYDPVLNRYISGVKNTVTTYDYNLLFAPPPSYPITGGYNILGWREVLTRP